MLTVTLLRNVKSCVVRWSTQLLLLVFIFMTLSYVLCRELDLNCAVIVSVEGCTVCVANTRVLHLFVFTIVFEFLQGHHFFPNLVVSYFFPLLSIPLFSSLLLASLRSTITISFIAEYRVVWCIICQCILCVLSFAVTTGFKEFSSLMCKNI